MTDIDIQNTKFQECISRISKDTPFYDIIVKEINKWWKTRHTNKRKFFDCFLSDENSCDEKDFFNYNLNGTYGIDGYNDFSCQKFFSGTRTTKNILSIDKLPKFITESSNGLNYKDKGTHVDEPTLLQIGLELKKAGFKVQIIKWTIWKRGYDYRSYSDDDDDYEIGENDHFMIFVGA